MATQTSKGLIKPDPIADLQTPVPFNQNSDRIDTYGMGPVLCTSTSRPTGTNLWDGLIIKESDTKQILTYDAASAKWRPVYTNDTRPFGHIAKASGFQGVSGLTLITMDGAMDLQGGMTWDNLSDCLILPVDGLYEVTGSAYITGGSGYPFTAGVRCVRAGATLWDTTIIAGYKSTADDVKQLGTVTCQLKAGDKLQLFQSHSVGSSWGDAVGYNGAWLEAKLV